MDNPVFKILESPANWCGMGLTLLGPFLAATEVIAVNGAVATGSAVLGYIVGFVVGGKVFGFPKLGVHADAESLAQTSHNEAQMKIISALASVRHRVELNPQKRLRRAIRERIIALCDQIEDVLSEWSNSSSNFALEDRFNLQQIAAKHLPDAIDRFSAIPKSFADTQMLDNGKTASQVFEETLDDLGAKILQLKGVLAQQMAESLVNHSTFVNQKFKRD